MAEITFIHAADLHLGRQFRGSIRATPEAADALRHAGYTAWQRIVDEAIARRVDFVTLGGDIFDLSAPSVRARTAFKEGIERLNDAGVRVFAALGNHDPLSDFPERLRRLPGLHVFAADMERVEFTAGVSVYGVSHERRAVRDNLVRMFRRDPGVRVAVGVIHANVSGVEGREPYAPCSLEDLKSAGMDVWCLGHAHTPDVLTRDPLVVYPGASQPIRPVERRRGGCRLIRVEAGCEAASEFIAVAPVVRWKLEIDTTSVEHAEDLVDLIERAASERLEDSEGVDAAILRVLLNGTSSGRFVDQCGSSDELTEIVRERAQVFATPTLIESIIDRTEPELDMDLLAVEESFLGELVRRARAAEEDPSVRERLLEPLRRELASRVSGRYPTDDFALTASDGPSQARTALIRDARNRAARIFITMSEE